MLEVVDLHKGYRSPAGEVVPTLEVPAFALAAGEQAALVGSSGSGKTTFLHLLAGILGADRGSIRYTLGGKVTDIGGLSEAARDVFRGRHIGYVFQTHHLLPGFSALENVQLGMAFAGGKSDKAWAAHLLERVGLADRLHYKPGKLSVGQQQRVAVARALANKPAVVLADEPTGALDAKNAEAVLELMRSLVEEAKAALLVVTHDAAVAGALPRRVDLAAINRVGGVRA